MLEPLQSPLLRISVLVLSYLIDRGPDLAMIVAACGLAHFPLTEELTLAHSGTPLTNHRMDKVSSASTVDK